MDTSPFLPPSRPPRETLEGGCICHPSQTDHEIGQPCTSRKRRTATRSLPDGYIPLPPPFPPAPGNPGGGMYLSSSTNDSQGRYVMFQLGEPLSTTWDQDSTKKFTT